MARTTETTLIGKDGLRELKDFGDAGVAQLRKYEQLIREDEKNGGNKTRLVKLAVRLTPHSTRERIFKVTTQARTLLVELP